MKTLHATYIVREGQVVRYGVWTREDGIRVATVLGGVAVIAN